MDCICFPYQPQGAFWVYVAPKVKKKNLNNYKMYNIYLQKKQNQLFAIYIKYMKK